MARSSGRDPVEKFRFLVTILDDSSPLNLGSSIINFEPSDTRAGFTQVTTPKVAVTEILHRENIDGNRPIKIAGLAKYEPVTLKRGVTFSKELYNWYKLVNDDSSTINQFSEALTGFGAIPFNNPRYRKEVLISSMDRTGRFIKHWLLVNAWPSGYAGGNDFNSSVEEILIEELTLSYESFLEVTGDSIQAALSAAQREAEQSTEEIAVAGAISGILGL